LKEVEVKDIKRNGLYSPWFRERAEDVRKDGCNKEKYFKIVKVLFWVKRGKKITISLKENERDKKKEKRDWVKGEKEKQN